jgi:transaldolase
MNKIIDNLKIKIFADGANKKDMLELYERSYIKGLTTNPTLMSKAKIENYEEFALSILR